MKIILKISGHWIVAKNLFFAHRMSLRVSESKHHEGERHLKKSLTEKKDSATFIQTLMWHTCCD